MPSFPSLTLGLIIIVIVAYIVGARWPMLAQKVGIA
jgi:hypothetical protein